MGSSASDTPRAPRIGLPTYVEPARWGAWDRPGGAAAHVLRRRGRRRRRAAGAAAARSTTGRRPTPGARRPRRPGAHRRRRRRPVPLRRRAAPGHPAHPARPRRLGAGAAPPRPWTATCRCWPSAAAPQLLNVALGGTLHQHVPDVVGHDGPPAGAGVFGATRVRLAPADAAGAILGAEVKVPLPPPPGPRHGSAAELEAVGMGRRRHVEAVESSPVAASPSACSGTPRRASTSACSRRSSRRPGRGAKPTPRGGSAVSTGGRHRRRRQPRHRAGRRRGRRHVGRGHRRGDRPRRAARRPGGRSRPPTGPGCCAASPRPSTPTSSTSPRWRSPTPGHTIGNARWEAGNVRDVLTYYAAAPERLFGRQIPVPGGVDVTFREPLGVVGVIVPWNFPMPIAAWGFAPALAAGNTVVLKPAELTPLTALRLGRAGARGRHPRGRLPGAARQGLASSAQRFVDHPDVRKIVFTGSTEVGQRVMAGCAEQVKRVTLELGGKSANIVFADADLERAAATAPYAVFDNAGQDCCARSRILVERCGLRPVPGPARAGGPAASRSAIPPTPHTEMGPLISAGHRDRVASLRARGRAGRVPRQLPGRARVLVPADGAGARSTEPTPACAEEIFGPGRRRRPVRRRGRRDPARQRQRLRPVRLHLDARRRPGAAGGSGRRERATSRSTRTPPSATGRRSAASSSPAWAVSSARTRWTPSPRPRTSS